MKNWEWIKNLPHKGENTNTTNVNGVRMITNNDIKHDSDKIEHHVSKMDSMDDIY